MVRSTSSYSYPPTPMTHTHMYTSSHSSIARVRACSRHGIGNVVAVVASDSDSNRVPLKFRAMLCCRCYTYIHYRMNKSFLIDCCCRSLQLMWLWIFCCRCCSYLIAHSLHVNPLCSYVAPAKLMLGGTGFARRTCKRSSTLSSWPRRAASSA